MDLERVAQGLHPIERAVLKALRSAHNLPQISKESGLKDVEIMRGLQWLSSKNLITISEQSELVVALGENGRRYSAEGLPEKRLLSALSAGPLPLRSIPLPPEESQIALGTLRKKNAISIEKQGGEVILSQTGFGKKLLERESFEEKFLSHPFPVSLASLTDADKLVLEELKGRKDIVRVEEVVVRSVTLTETGKQLLIVGISEDTIDTLTPAILSSGAWRTKPLRRYDLHAPVPTVNPGKKQHYRRFLDEVRSRFMALGFQEMRGPIVESDFWDMDALFMPQFHSARDIHDAYYIKDPTSAASLPHDLVSRVKAAHEHGGESGSKGWRYQFDLARTHRLLLRTQGTALSARQLASPDLKVPGKYFAIARCFRSDVIDATHLADFFQTEGIVIEKGLTMRHLTGLLAMFAKEFAGATEVKITPSYFPFTEPSASLYAKHPQMGWIELGGSGIFRPEMTSALGIKEPVIAWGIGIDRIAMFRLGLRDIRDLFSKDLRTLREARVL